MTKLTDKKNLGKALKWVLSLATAAVLLYFSFRWVRWEEFIEGIRGCNTAYIIGSMAASTAAFFIRAYRWRAIMRPMNREIGFAESFDGINIGNLSNFVFPRIGEFVRCGIISSTGKLPYNKVLGSVVMERSWDMISLAVILVAFFAMKWGEFGTFVSERMIVPAEEAIPFSLWWIAVLAVAAAAAGLYLIYRGRTRNRLCSGLWRLAAGAAEGFAAAMKMERKYLFILSTLVLWFLYWLMSWLTMEALPQLSSLGAADAMFLMLVGSVAWLVPVPGAIGAFHLLVSLALGTIYGVGQGEAMAFATVSHESQAVTMILCGIFCAVRRVRAGGRLYGR